MSTGENSVDALLHRVWRKLGLPIGEWQAFVFPDAERWARWSERQQRRWQARARGASGLPFLRRKQPFHPAARPRVAQAYGLVGRLQRETPRFWLHRVPPLTEHARGSEAMALLREAEEEFRRSGDSLGLAVTLELQGLLSHGPLASAFEADRCRREAARLADEGGWKTLAALERTRGELWESWWIAECGSRPG